MTTTDRIKLRGTASSVNKTETHKKKLIGRVRATNDERCIAMCQTRASPNMNNTCLPSNTSARNEAISEKTMEIEEVTV